MEVAISKNDHAEVERINKRLQQLEPSRKSKEKDAQAIRLAEKINRKNRAEKTSKMHQKQNGSLKAGEAGYDPFSRRLIRSRNYYICFKAWYYWWRIIWR